MKSRWLYSRDARIFQYLQISVIYHINKLKHKNHMIISIDAEKFFDKIQYPFTIKTLKKVDKERANLNIITAIYDETGASLVAQS